MLAWESLPLRILSTIVFLDSIYTPLRVIGSTSELPAGWNPNSPAELFLGMLPYLLVFLIVPIGLLLVCWCSRSFLHVCSRRLTSGRSNSPRPAGCLGRLFPWTVQNPTTPTPDLNARTDTPTAAGTGPQSQQQPATLFTNYTNYNPILEGELDLFPITYTPQPGDVQRNVSQCSPGFFMDLPTFPFMGDRRSVMESRLEDSPPRYTEDPPPSYESLFSNGPDVKAEFHIDDLRVHQHHQPVN